MPVALAAQLIVSATAFGVIGGLVVHTRWPTGVEAAVVGVLIVGVVLAIRIFHRGHTMKLFRRFLDFPAEFGLAKIAGRKYQTQELTHRKTVWRAHLSP